MSKHVLLSQLQDVVNSITSKADLRFAKIGDIVDYTITKQQTADTGYSATYQLFKGSTAVGDKINIPKDMVVSAGEVKTVTTANVPYEGAQVGDKYIDLTIANAQQDHIYIPVKDLVDVYTAGNGLSLSNGEFSVVIDNTSANGLSVGASGVALAAATTTTAGAMSAADKTKLNGISTGATATSASADYNAGVKVATITVDGTDTNVYVPAATTSAAGTMSAEDKAKLDAADVTAYTAGNGINITSHAISAVVDSTNANGLSVGANGLALAAATTSTAGAMSATDKSKLDNADVTAYTAGNGINITSHAVSAVVDTTNANGLSVGASGLALAAASTSAAGAMSAADKTKLDNIEDATSADITALIATIWPAE